MSHRIGKLLTVCLTVLLLAFANPLVANDLASLSDEFDDGSTIAKWLRVHSVESWFADQLETYDIDQSQPGRMVMMPYTSTWYQDYRGVMSFKEVSGDFVMTTEVHVSARDGVSIPGVDSQFALAGIMIRTPRNITPATWVSGGENYIFLSLGYGNANPPTYQYEVKTTIGSNSTLVLAPAPANNAVIQLAKIDSYVITLRRDPGQPWVVHRRYVRTDMPATLQLGLVTYTDWVKASRFAPFVHNSTVLADRLPDGVTDPAPQIPYDPDIISGFEYARVFRPVVPPQLKGLDLSDPEQVSDSDLLSFLGANANIPAPQEPVPATSTWGLLSFALALLTAVTIIFHRSPSHDQIAA